MSLILEQQCSLAVAQVRMRRACHFLFHKASGVSRIPRKNEFKLDAGANDVPYLCFANDASVKVCTFSFAKVRAQFVE